MLRLAGASLAVLAGCPGGNSPQPETKTTSTTPSATTRGATPAPAVPARYSETFDSIVDVTAVGADPTGSKPIGDVVRSHADDGTLFVFPDGTYRIDRLSMQTPDKFGLVAAPDASPAIAPTGNDPDSEWLFLDDATDFLWQGIDLDVRESGRLGGIDVTGPGRIELRGIRVRGGYDTIDQQLIRIDVTDRDGQALVENFTASGVDKPNVDTTGIYVGRTHAGEITFRNCRLEGFSDNALYASPPGGDGGRYDAADGTVHVDGGLFKNNNIASIRIGSTGSTVRNATVVVDEVPRHEEGSLNARGIRLRGKRDQLVENCRLVYGPEAGWTSGALTFNGTNGYARIKDVSIEMNRDETRAILAKSPMRDDDVAPTFENVDISGTAVQNQAVTITGRPGTVFRNCCIHQTGSQRDGIQFVQSADCAVENSRIDVSGSPIVLEHSSLRSKSLSSNCGGRIDEWLSRLS